KRARVACSRQLPGRSAEAAPDAAAPGLPRDPELAAAVGGGIGAALGLDDPINPAGTATLLRPAGRCPAASIETARSGSAHDEPRAGQGAADAHQPGTGHGDGAAAAGRPPHAAGQESQDEPLVPGDDDEGLPAARVTAAGATADPVQDYPRQIGKVPLLAAGQAVDLAKR